MTPEQAAEVVAYLTAAFPRDAIEDETFAVFTADVTLLQDFEYAYEASRELSRAQDRFPTIRELRDHYHAVARRYAVENARTHGLPEAPRGETPEFVHVWYWARYARDPVELRAFPQMIDPDNGLPLTDELYLSTTDYAGLLVEWRAAGEPKFGTPLALMDALASSGAKRHD